ncbi:small-conductance mechanosensitive channel [Homoserinimonas aerilata]|uniref:Small-conductance mechanosensitive channel n=1 Tax=Homoserinimonas aerilata TaxID=1162970 RepID=A0A542YFC2_9MICO|nr:mechanosensitive ion channel family protein [Homoserinimonas aerilata]TQL46785.1 small-conductance mechanosensitive channel [Homoserinimonas aerilata]
MPIQEDDLTGWGPWLGTLLAIAVAVVAVVVLVLLVRLVVALASRRAPWMGLLLQRMRHRWRFLLLVVALWVACAVSAPADLPWWPALSRVFLIVVILTAGWLLSAITSFGIERVMARYDASGVLGPEARRMRTQLSVVQRLATVLIAVIAFGAVLFTFPEVRAVGASVLASAGIVSIIAGLAAQSTLGNLIAGIQLAFSDAIRVGDVVVVEGEWGRIGEITLSYVVVNVWDERRLVLPSTYFTSKPFESWTRRSDKILGTVYMDLDWRVPVEAVREKFMEIVEGSDAWDRRAASVLVTGSEGGFVTLRFLVSSADSGDQWALRCLVREEIMTWLQAEHPEALPVTRVSLEQPRVSSEQPHD